MKQFRIFGGNERLIAALLEQAVRFIVVGGLAVQYYVPERPANDLDLLIEQTKENANRLFSALAAEHVVPSFPVELISEPGDRPQQMPLKALHYADLLTPGQAIDFSAEWERAEIARIGLHEVRFAAKELLLQMKRNTGRQRDAEDVALLEAGA